MGGPITALADDYTGAFDNPAGSALTLGGLDLTISSASIEDDLHMLPGQRLNYYMGGLAIPFEGYGISGGYSTPFSSVSPGEEKIDYVEYRIALSKTFLQKRLSIGFGAGWGTLKTTERNATVPRFIFGGLYRFPKRIMLGLSYTPGSVFDPDSQGRGFSVPHQISLGVGWIPNRFLRGGLSLRAVAPESNVYSFHWPDLEVGKDWVYQPHFGADYHFLHLKKIKGRVFAGAYIESRRGVGESRFHYTTGTELQLWFLKVGIALDKGVGYQNVSLGFGLDVGEVLRKLQMLPPEAPILTGGLFPSPFEISDDWLPTQLQDNPEDAFQSIGTDVDDVKRGIENFPKNIKNMKGFGDDIDELMDE